ncbi:Methyltransferase FkbM domain-containing protein [Caenorhabditis elegans]|uniref:Methyltransferase FkbM domain-containing protein n=1 Tax=Caenorhabditis elegans TaxID=6239 RepID=O45705_CAEEL|nr:Methyltransferase FkbM domain-containing protein [Caenorhabditis elegans]CAB05269.3 Methyltransferase FkbM domain-containing protein [Caenorhabditis elegans]|eukprot:NP_502714.3 Uncharacterized protein CELE_R05A10.8 [Caenorhabditis elegans]
MGSPEPCNIHQFLVVKFLFILLSLNVVTFFIIAKNSQNECGAEVFNIYNANAIHELRFKYRRDEGQYRRELYKASKNNDNGEFYEKVKIEALCLTKEKIGGFKDGGKYVCNPKKAGKKNCTIVSLGLKNQINFDLHIQNVTDGRCLILGADKDPQNQQTQESYRKINGKLFTGKIPDELTIPYMLEKAGKHEVELLKIDIEEGELTGLEPLIKDFFVCQIFIEVHGTPLKHLDMLQIMARYGFRIFNTESNPFCSTCHEYSLINENCMIHYGAVLLGRIL